MGIRQGQDGQWAKSARAKNSLSRRQMLVLTAATAVTAVGSTPAPALAATDLEPNDYPLNGNGDWTLQWKRGDAAIRDRHGRAFWIREDDFRGAPSHGGGPRLTAVSTRHGSDTVYRLELRDACYPGSGLRADLDFEITTAPGGKPPQVRLQFRRLGPRFGPFQRPVDFQWQAIDRLFDETSGLTTASVETDFALLEHPAMAVIVSGRANVRFFTDWGLEVDPANPDRSPIRLSTPEGQTAVGRVRVDRGQTSAPEPPKPPKPSRVRLGRGQLSSWHVGLPQPPVHVGRLHRLCMPDHLDLELGHDLEGLRALTVSHVDDVPPSDHPMVGLWTFRPGGALIGDNGRPLELPLKDARYEAVYDDQRVLTVELRAGFDSCWFTTGRACIRVAGSADGDDSFIASPAADGTPNFLCRPRVSAMSLNFATGGRAVGTIAGNTPIPLDGKYLVLYGGATALPVEATNDDLKLEILSSRSCRLTVPHAVLDGRRIPVIRTEDFFVADLEFTGMDLHVDCGGIRRVATLVPTAAGLITLHLPPQSVGEQALQVPSADLNEPWRIDFTKFPLASRLAEGSRLVFSVDTGRRISATLDDILIDLADLPMHVTDVANGLDKGDQPKEAQKPAGDRTAIEAPYRLLLSPPESGRWRHAGSPAGAANPSPGGEATRRYELWHTRLRDDDPASEPTLRALWARDKDSSAPKIDTADTAWSLSAEHRIQIADQLGTGDRQQVIRRRRVVSDPAHGIDDSGHVESDEMMILTALGAWLNLQYVNPYPAGELGEWVHLATMGRDHYVRVVTRGFLCPTGHPASLVTVAERKISYAPSSDKVNPVESYAFVHKRYFIVVREPSVGLNNPDCCFCRITIRTRFTPDLFPLLQPVVPGTPRINIENPKDWHFKKSTPGEPPSQPPNETQTSAFWIQLPSRTGGQPEDFLFDVVGYDQQQREIPFKMPMVYVPALDSGEAVDMDAVRNWYSKDARSRVPVGQQKVAYTPPALSNSPVGVPAEHPAVLPTETLHFDVACDSETNALQGFGTTLWKKLAETCTDLPTTFPTFKPQVVPVVKRAWTKITALKDLMNIDSAVPITYFSNYVSRTRSELDKVLTAQFDQLQGDFDELKHEFNAFKAGLEALGPTDSRIQAATAKVREWVQNYGRHHRLVLRQEVQREVDKLHGTFAKLEDVFAPAVDAAQKVQFGLAAPTLQVLGLSRTIGPLVGSAMDLEKRAEKELGALQDTIKNAGDAVAAKAKALELAACKQVDDLIAAMHGGVDKTKKEVNDFLNKLSELARANGRDMWEMSYRELLVLDGAIHGQIKTFVDSIHTTLSSPLPAGGFDLGSCFPDTKILGAIPLKDLIGAIGMAPKLMGQLKGQLKSTASTEANAAVERLYEEYRRLRTQIPNLKSLSLPNIPREVKWDWEKNSLEEKSFGIVKFVNNYRDVDTKLAIHARLGVDPATLTPTRDVRGELTNFQVDIAEMIRVAFSALTFTSKTGQDTHVDVQVDDVKFIGVLQFVARLQEYFSDIFKGGPKIELAARYVEASFAISLPDIPMAAFSLTGVKFATSLQLPFDERPLVLRFSLAEKKSPFHLSILIFSGGGFLSLQIPSNTAGEHAKLRQLEGALEFGGYFPLDLFIAHGEVHVFAGIYFHVSGDSTLLSGYFRAGGSLDVLGLITAFVEFDVSLSYENGRAAGQCTVTVGIEIGFFEIDVDLTLRKEFSAGGDQAAAAAVGPPGPARLPGGDPADPVVYAMVLASEPSDTPTTLKDFMCPDQWETYWQAFAEAGR